MPLFKRDKDEDARKGYMTKSGRWVTPKAQQPAQPGQPAAQPGQPAAQPGQPAAQPAQPAQPAAQPAQPAQPAAQPAQPPVDNQKLNETLSQLDIDIPGMVVLKSKEDRHLGRLNQDMRAKEEYTSSHTNPNASPSAPASGQQPAAGSSGPLDPTQVEAGEMLLQALLEKNQLSPEQITDLRSFSQEMNVTIVEAVVSAELMGSQILGVFIAAECKIPFSKLDVLRIHPNTKGIMAEADMLKYQVMPLSKIGSTLNVAAVNPLSNKALDDLRRESGFDVKCIVCTLATLRNSYQKYYG